MRGYVRHGEAVCREWKWAPLRRVGAVNQGGGGGEKNHELLSEVQGGHKDLTLSRLTTKKQTGKQLWSILDRLKGRRRWWWWLKTKEKKKREEEEKRKRKGQQLDIIHKAFHIVSTFVHMLLTFYLLSDLMAGLHTSRVLIYTKTQLPIYRRGCI